MALGPPPIILKGNPMNKTLDKRLSPKGSIWTIQLSEALRERWEANMPTRQIAAELSVLAGVPVNKNMVISRAQRSGVEPHKLAILPRITTSSTGARNIPEHPPLGRCCYPSGDVGKANFAWCGAELGKHGSYCDEHHVMCYRPEDTRPRPNYNYRTYRRRLFLQK